MSALVVNAIKEARTQMPVDEAVLRLEFLEKFVPPPIAWCMSAFAAMHRLHLRFFALSR